MALLAEDAGAELGSPFLDPGFLTALAAAGGRWGWGDRRRTMRALFGDLLPEEVIDRRGKAEFSGALFGPHTERFAAEWDGGVVPGNEFLDPDALRETWQSPQPHFLSAMALQHSWIAADAHGWRAPEHPVAERDASAEDRRKLTLPLYGEAVRG
jgi:asparagine synthase (glutamine-hydrolysing)